MKTFLNLGLVQQIYLYIYIKLLKIIKFNNVNN